MIRSRLLIILAAMLGLETVAAGALVPITRRSLIAVRGEAGPRSGFDEREWTTYEPFADTLSLLIIETPGNASVQSRQSSDISAPGGGISATGDVVTAPSGDATSSGTSTFRYAFRVTDEDVVMRYASSLAWTGLGSGRSVLTEFSPTTGSRTLYIAQITAPESDPGPVTFSREFTLRAGSVYQLDFEAHSRQVGTASFVGSLWPVPECGLASLLVPVSLALACRRRRSMTM